jgi:hypothetical protein
MNNVLHHTGAWLVYGLGHDIRNGGFWEPFKKTFKA